MVKYLEIDRNNTSAERTGNTFIERVNSHSNFIYGKANCQSDGTRIFINMTLMQSYNRLDMFKIPLIIHDRRFKKVVKFNKKKTQHTC